MIVRNDCNQEEGRLTFEMDGNCVDITDLLASCDNTEVISMLNDIIEKQDKCCDPITIEVPVEVIKYVEVLTIKYVKVDCDSTRPPDVVITRPPSNTRPTSETGTGVIRGRRYKGWIEIYNTGLYYKHSLYDKYFFTSDPGNITFYGVVKNTMNETSFYSRYPQYSNRAFLQNSPKIVDRIKGAPGWNYKYIVNEKRFSYYLIGNDNIVVDGEELLQLYPDAILPVRKKPSPGFKTINTSSNVRPDIKEYALSQAIAMGLCNNKGVGYKNGELAKSSPGIKTTYKNIHRK